MSSLNNVFLILFIFNLIFIQSSLTATDREISSLTTKTKTTADDLKPNIIFFLVDDWGYNDVGYYGNTATQTPFIDSLVKSESLRIDKHYVMPECTASRCALLTGRYPMRYGMQGGILYYTSRYALSRYETLLSNEFQSNGYHTHLVGKWHLGMKAWDYTPTYRGFDTFLGFYSGYVDYYTHYGYDMKFSSTVDFRRDESPYDEPDTYSLGIYGNEILSLLESYDNRDATVSSTSNENNQNKNNKEPFFMYVGWQGSHSPSEAPEQYVGMYDRDSDQDSEERVNFQAQTTMTDDLFGEMIHKIKELNLWDNTLIVFASDNGADYGYGDNSPLRGSKFTLWEGGVRVPAFITGGYLPPHLRGQVFNQHAIHITDWYSTLINGVANIEKLETPNKLDGTNMWNYILSSNTNQDSSDNLNDNSENSNKNSDKNNENMSELDDRYILINAYSDDCSTEEGVCGAILYGSRWKLVYNNNQVYSTENFVGNKATCFWHRDFQLNKDSDSHLACGEVPIDVSNYNEEEDDGDCPCTSENGCLFDLSKDPCEYYDVSNDYPEIYDQLLNKLKDYYENEQSAALEGIYYQEVYGAVNPALFNDGENGTLFWTPWDQDTEWQDQAFEQLLMPNYEWADDNVDSDDVIENDNNNENSEANVFNNDNMKVTYEKDFITFLIIVSVIFILFFTMTYCYLKIQAKRSKDINDLNYIDIRSSNDISHDTALLLDMNSKHPYYSTQILDDNSLQ